MPHAPILTPTLSGARAGSIDSTVGAMREAARRLVATEADAIVLVSPHSPRAPQAFGVWTSERLSGTLGAFRRPNEAVDFQNDTLLAAQVARQAAERGLRTEAITDGDLDHGAVVPLLFAAEAGWRAPIVVLSLDLGGDLNVVRFGEAVAYAAEGAGRRVAFIASGDMSHRLTPSAPYGFNPRGAEFDGWLVSRLRRGAYRELLNFCADLKEAAGEDALDSVLVALGSTAFKTTGSELLSYESPFGVGYAVAVLYTELCSVLEKHA